MKKLILISGGQTGVDQAAFQAGIDRGLIIGGWCPPGRACESGIIPPQFPMRETPADCSPNAPEVPRSQRTEWNVRDSDATLILYPAKLQQTIDLGIEWTKRCTFLYKKQMLIVDPFAPECISNIGTWLNNTSIEVLNVAGPSEQTFPGINKKTYNILNEVFKRGV